MFAFIRGTIIDSEPGQVTLFVPQGAEGEQGLGYEIRVSAGAHSAEYLTGQKAAFYLHTHVREDALELYGFESPREKQLFLDLVSVSGIGPKGAMNILSNSSVDAILQAILEKNLDALTALPGIGKKTGERLLVELGDRLRKRAPSGAVSAKGAHSKTGHGVSSEVWQVAWHDAKEALVQLGFKEAKVIDALRAYLSENESDSRVKPTTESLLKGALAHLRG